MKRFLLSFSMVLSVVLFPSLALAKNYEPIQWVDLIPQADLDALLNPPAAISAVPHGSDQGALDSLADSVAKAIGDSIGGVSSEDQAYYDALKSTKINSEFNQKEIRIAGFIVPVEFDDNQVITEFFLVPYFGACIHVPPPPPNQIIYVKFPKGMTLEALYDPFWIEGQLLTSLVENDLATSAYTLNAAAVKPYEPYNQ